MPCRITFPNVITWSFRTRWHSESQFREEWVKGGTRPAGGANDVETSFWCQISPKINTEVKILNSSEGLLQNTLYLIDNVDSERQHTLECQPVSINPPEGRQWSVTHVCCMEILLVVTNMAVSSVNQSHQKHIDSMLSFFQSLRDNEYLGDFQVPSTEGTEMLEFCSSVIFYTQNQGWQQSP